MQTEHNKIKTRSLFKADDIRKGRWGTGNVLTKMGTKGDEWMNSRLQPLIGLCQPYFALQLLWDMYALQRVGLNDHWGFLPTP